MNNTRITVIKPTKTSFPQRVRVASYARVSVKGEMNEHSLKEQVDYYSAKIDSNALWINAGTYADYGLTGTKTARPGFQKLMEACNNGDIDLIITKSISRFARNTVDLLNTVRHLKDLGINVRFEKEHIDSISPEGELMLTLLASFAQEESRSISENLKWRIIKNFEQGKPNHFILYGYRWNGNSFDIVPQEAEIVKMVFNLYLEGRSPEQIASILNEQGYKPRNGEKFTYSRIWKMLRIESYSGNTMLYKTYRENHITKKKMINHGEIPMYYATETHPEIIKKETYDAVQTEIGKRKDLGYLANQKTNFTCFSGLIFCAKCGHTYRRRMSSMEHRINREYKWKCGTKIGNGASSCKAQNLPEKVLYAFTMQVIKSEFLDQNKVRQTIKRIEVSDPFTLTFFLKDGKQISKQWHYDDKKKDYREVKDGRFCNIYSGN